LLTPIQQEQRIPASAAIPVACGANVPEAGAVLSAPGAICPASGAYCFELILKSRASGAIWSASDAMFSAFDALLFKLIQGLAESDA
jgi:hypothetical protein